MTRALRPEPARGDDLPAIRVLLDASGLPHEDIGTPHLVNFVVLRGASGLAGVGGVEIQGADGLLRSVAVAPGQQQHGLGRALVEACEARARDQGATALYLLTTTAAEYFAHRGYRRVDRAAAPAAIQATREFAALCPSEAVCMVKELSA
jgi:amino-acid N-acetyltransferase